MKSMNSKLTAITAVLTLCAGMALAQSGSGAPMHHRRGGFMGGMELPLRQLNLTDDQKAQIKQIFQAEKPSMKPLMEQEHTARMQMVQLVTIESRGNCCTRISNPYADRNCACKDRIAHLSTAEL
jgi:Spy/CpxP family protein refolding chaperone